MMRALDVDIGQLLYCPLETPFVLSKLEAVCNHADVVPKSAARIASVAFVQLGATALIEPFLKVFDRVLV